MRRLDERQASALRELRKEASAAATHLGVLAVDTCHHCGHEDHDADCPVCLLHRLACQSFDALELYRDQLDGFLSRGPHPTPGIRPPGE